MALSSLVHCFVIRQEVPNPDRPSYPNAIHRHAHTIGQNLRRQILCFASGDPASTVQYDFRESAPTPYAGLAKDTGRARQFSPLIGAQHNE